MPSGQSPAYPSEFRQKPTYNFTSLGRVKIPNQLDELYDSLHHAFSISAQCQPPAL